MKPYLPFKSVYCVITGRLWTCNYHGKTQGFSDNFGWGNGEQILLKTARRPEGKSKSTFNSHTYH